MIHRDGTLALVMRFAWLMPLMAIAVLLVVLLLSVASHAQTEPPLAGDWVVADDTLVEGRAVRLQGNLTVTGTGSLTLIDVELTFTGGGSRLEVLGSGELVVRDADGDPSTSYDSTNVTGPDDSSGVSLTVQAGSVVVIDCSMLRWASLAVMTDTATIRNATIIGSPSGVDFTGCAGRLETTAISGARGTGVVVRGGSLTMDRCEVRDCAGGGLRIGADSSARLSGCNFSGNSPNAIVVEAGASCDLVDASFSDNGQAAILCEDGGRLDWMVGANSSATNDTFLLRGNITVSGGGALALVNATVRLLCASDLEFGVLVDGGTLRVIDGDGDATTREDRSAIEGGPAGPEYLETRVSVREGGRIEGMASMFLGASVWVQEGSCELHGCMLGHCDVALDVIWMSWLDEVIVDGCTFVNSTIGIKAYGFYRLKILDSTFSSCGVGISATGCDEMSVAGCGLDTCSVGLSVISGEDVRIDHVTMDECDTGINASGAQDLDVTGCSINSSRFYGVRLYYSTVAILSTTIRDCEGVGVFSSFATWLMGRKSINIQDTSIEGFGGAGLWLNQSSFQLSSVRVSGGAGPGVCADATYGVIERSDISSLGRVALSAINNAFVSCYDTVLALNDCETRAWSGITVYHSVCVRVELDDGMAITVPFLVGITDAMGDIAFQEMVTGMGSTHWTYLMQFEIGPERTDRYSPYTCTVTIEGRPFVSTFNVTERMEHSVLLHHGVEARIADIGPVEEGSVVHLRGTSSGSLPFNLAMYEWDLDFDGTFAANGTGPVLEWSVGYEGVRKVALRVTDSIGGRSVAIIDVYVLDAGPRDLNLTLPAGAVAEDEVVELGCHADVVLDPISHYEWDLGDGKKRQGDRVNVSWPRNGNYSVHVRAVDTDGSVLEANATVEVVNLPPVASVREERVRVGKHEPVALDASGSHDTPSDNGSLAFEWALEGGDTRTGVRATLSFERAGTYRVNLTVRDDDGATSSASVTIEVYNLPPTIGGLEDIHFASGGEVREVPLGNVITDPDDAPGLLDVSAGCDMGGVANVSVVRQGNGTCMLVVTAGKPGSEAVTATIWVEVTDGDSGTARTTFNVTIAPPPPRPHDEKTGWNPLAILLVVGVLVVALILLTWRLRR